MSLNFLVFHLAFSNDLWKRLGRFLFNSVSLCHWRHHQFHVDILESANWINQIQFRLDLTSKPKIVNLLFVFEVHVADDILWLVQQWDSRSQSAFGLHLWFSIFIQFAIGKRNQASWVIFSLSLLFASR